jgi:hypothetical protein
MGIASVFKISGGHSARIPHLPAKWRGSTQTEWKMGGYHIGDNGEGQGARVVRTFGKPAVLAAQHDVLATALAMEHTLSHRYRRPFQHDLPSVWWHDLQLDLSYSESDTTLRVVTRLECIQS